MRAPARLALPALLALAASGLALSGCRARPPAAATSEPKAVENATLGLAIRPLPPGFEVAENAGDRLRFDATLDGVPGSAAIAVGPPEPAGINLVAESKAWGEAAARAPGGKFFGGNQLVTPTGDAYTVRALVDGGQTEERRVFMLHPGGGDRLLTLTLRYPPGDATVANGRLRQLIDLLGALEPFSDPGAARN
jgi:hypothetical protein